MRARAINAPDAPAPQGGYAQAIEVTHATRLLFISGQVPETAAGVVPEDFRSQARLAWAHIVAQLTAAGLGVANLVKVTTFLASRQHAADNSEIRQEVSPGISSPSVARAPRCRRDAPRGLRNGEGIVDTMLSRSDGARRTTASISAAAVGGG